MTVTDFFDRLVSAPPPLLKKTVATVRFEVIEGVTTRHYLATLDHGRVTVAQRRGRADTVIRLEHSLFERLLAGRANAMAAALRGELTVEGQRVILVALQRLMPGPKEEGR